MMAQPTPTGAGNERRVTRVAFQQHDPSRVNVFVDGRFALAISAVEAVHRGLKPGRLLTPDDIAALQQLEERERARNSALALLAVRPRSWRELTDRLTRKDIPADVVASVIDDLARRGYVDDAAFARYWVENRQANRPRGRRALTAELRAKGIDAAIASDATAAAGDETATALALARRRAATLHEPDPRRFRQRLGAFLQRKGYDYDTVRSVVATVLDEQVAPVDDDDPA